MRCLFLSILFLANCAQTVEISARAELGAQIYELSRDSHRSSLNRTPPLILSNEMIVQDCVITLHKYQNGQQFSRVPVDLRRAYLFRIDGVNPFLFRRLGNDPPARTSDAIIQFLPTDGVPFESENWNVGTDPDWPAYMTRDVPRPTHYLFDNPTMEHVKALTDAILAYQATYCSD